MKTAKSIDFTTRDGLSLVGEAYGADEARPVVFLHGGGQTRRSWKASLPVIAELGFRTIAFDARGHGESDWSPDADYRLEAFADDLAMVVAQLGRPPIIVGASLGGITGLLMVGEALHQVAHALVLVDVAPRINPAGVDRILGFMAENPDGFASVSDAAAAVARYNPHRPPPANLQGLAASLRERNGRLFWHWDPAFLEQRREGRAALQERIEAAARAINIPTLLVHAARSDVVTADEIKHFETLIPDGRYVSVPAAGHMVAGDANDVFNNAIMDFLASLPT